MRYFVTGTDTDVGKTLATALLLAGSGAAYWKPVQSGAPTDTDQVRAWLPETTIYPERYRLCEPLSPHAAAAIDGVSIALSDFTLPTEGPLLVEGAGGLMVPINNEHLIIDLIEQLQLPVILVARSGLGTLNHTLLSLQALALRSIPVAGVVMNGRINPSNKETIEAFGNVEIIAQIPPLESIDHLSQHYQESFTWQWQQQHGTPLLT